MKISSEQNKNDIKIKAQMSKDKNASNLTAQANGA